MPTTRAGSLTAEAISVIDKAEVFVAKTASGRQSASSLEKSSCLRAIRSGIASMTSVAPAASSSLSDPRTRPRTAWASSSDSFPRSTPLRRFASIRPTPRSSAWACASIKTTSKPPLARLWAIPLPITPAPMTAAVLLVKNLPGAARTSMHRFHIPREHADLADRLHQAIEDRIPIEGNVGRAHVVDVTAEHGDPLHRLRPAADRLRARTAADAMDERRRRRFGIRDSEFKPGEGIFGYGPIQP